MPMLGVPQARVEFRWQLKAGLSDRIPHVVQLAARVIEK